MQHSRQLQIRGVFHFDPAVQPRLYRSYSSDANVTVSSHGGHRLKKWIAIGSIFYLCSAIAISLFSGWLISLMLPPGQIDLLNLAIAIAEMIAKLLVPLVIFHASYALISKILVRKRG